MTTYKTRNGDMWDRIAYRLTGSTEQIVPIMQANPQYTDTWIFPAGVELSIPDLNSMIDSTVVLPPWALEEGE